MKSVILRYAVLLALCIALFLFAACAPSGSTLSEALGNATSSSVATENNTMEPSPEPTSSQSVGGVSATETFDSNGYPPATFAVETRMPIPEGTPQATPMAGKKEHVERTLTALGQQITIKADVVMSEGSLNRYQASLRRQTSEEQLSKQKDFFFGAGVKLSSADPAYLKRFYQSNTVSLFSPENRQNLLLINQSAGDVYSVTFGNDGPWRYQINTEDPSIMQSQAFSLISMLFCDEFISPIPYQVSVPYSAEDDPIIMIDFAQLLDGLPIACDITSDGGVLFPHPKMSVAVAIDDWSHKGFYGVQLKKGDVRSLAANFLYTIDKSVGTTDIIALDRLLDIMQEKKLFLSMITTDTSKPVFDTVRLVYDVEDYAKALAGNPFVLKPYWEFGRYNANALMTYRYDADPEAYR